METTAMQSSVLPVPTPETRHFWECTRRGELLLQQCNDCSLIYFPPRPFCPTCACRQIGLVGTRGRGRLYSYFISHVKAPGFIPPFAIAAVELEEGLRMMSNIVDCPQNTDVLKLDMPVEVVFERQNDEIFLPTFRPVSI